MSVSSGTRVGPYEIIAPIGAGGMGEVFRARDSRLNRDVAIKILPAGFANDKDRVAPFRREAQVVASLNHSHIADIHGLEESSGIVALVLELKSRRSNPGRCRWSPDGRALIFFADDEAGRAVLYRRHQKGVNTQ